jgi:predicted nucleotidyltransferase
MKKSLEHLPEHKQAELELIKDIILEKLPDVRMIILFGSFARGDWVEDTHIEDKAVHVYESDYDILVATKTAKEADSYNIQDTITKAIEAVGKVTTPVNIIYHSFAYISKMLTEGHYFFCDIKKEGIHLYRKSSKFSLGKIKILTSEGRRKLAGEHFDQWFKKAKGAYRGYER